MQKGCPAFAQRHDVVLASNWKHFSVSPKISSARIERLSREKLCDAGEIVADEKGFPAFRAHVVQFSRFVLALTSRALEILDVHSVSPDGKSAGRCEHTIL